MRVSGARNYVMVRVMSRPASTVRVGHIMGYLEVLQASELPGESSYHVVYLIKSSSHLSVKHRLGNKVHIIIKASHE